MKRLLFILLSTGLIQTALYTPGAAQQGAREVVSEGVGSEPIPNRVRSNWGNRV